MRKLYQIASVILAGMMFIVMPASSFTPTPEELEKKLQENKREYQKHIPQKENKNTEQMKKEAQKSYREFQQKVMPEVEKWKDRMKYDGERLVINGGNIKQKNEKEEGMREFLKKDERLYIFVSSSIPKTTLRNYARSIDKLREPNIQMVLRGCIGGCTKLMPTAQFIQEIIAPSKDEELAAEFIIDPMLFRHYKIQRVPAIVFASGVTAADLEASEGMPENLKGTPKAYIIYGDVSLDFALEKIYAKTNNSGVQSMLKELRKDWFSEKSGNKEFCGQRQNK